MSRRIKLKDLVILMINEGVMSHAKLVYGTFILSRAIGNKTRICDIKRVIKQLLKEGVIEHV